MMMKCSNTQQLRRPAAVTRRPAATSRRSAKTYAGATGTFIVGGNRKCNGTHDSVEVLVNGLNAGTIDANVEIVCAPPFVFLNQVLDTLDKSKFSIAAQNCWIGDGGAYTGEVCANMLTDLSIPWVILGHSERRSLCGETNDIVGTKVAYALSKGLKVIACVGESLEERESGTTMKVVEEQLAAIANVVDKTGWKDVVVAYEPVWAIGTGKVATPDQAQEVHAGIRAWFANSVGADVASSVRIQYGGSVNAGNCAELAGMEDIDGFLVGGASLKAEDFVTICNSAKFSS